MSPFVHSTDTTPRSRAGWRACAPSRPLPATSGQAAGAAGAARSTPDRNPTRVARLREQFLAAREVVAR
jgi:hypothetical protein